MGPGRSVFSQTVSSFWSKLVLSITANAKVWGRHLHKQVSTQQVDGSCFAFGFKGYHAGTNFLVNKIVDEDPVFTFKKILKVFLNIQILQRFLYTYGQWNGADKYPVLEASIHFQL